MLIDRLLRRNQHEFATKVTKLLRMPPEEGENRILVQWAVQEVWFFSLKISFISIISSLLILRIKLKMQLQKQLKIVLMMYLVYHLLILLKKHLN